MAVAQDALAEAQQQQIDQLRAQLLAAVAAIYGASIAADMLTNPAAMLTFLRRLVPLSLAAQASMVRSTQLDLARQLPLDRPILLKPTDIIGAKLRGKPIEQVYSRAVYDVEDRLDAGDSFEDAVAFGLHRVTQNAVTDLQLARTHSTAAYVDQLQDQLRVKVGTMRTLSTTKPNHCALCVLAATQVYYKPGKLMDIHPGCGCGQEIVFEDEFDERRDEMDRQYLDLHNAIRRDLGDEFQSSDAWSGAEMYKNIVITHEHGELGPILSVRGQRYEGPKQRAKAKDLRWSPNRGRTDVRTSVPPNPQTNSSSGVPDVPAL